MDMNLNLKTKTDKTHTHTICCVDGPPVASLSPEQLLPSKLPVRPPILFPADEAGVFVGRMNRSHP